MLKAYCTYTLLGAVYFMIYTEQQSLHKSADIYAISSFDSPLLDASDNFIAGAEWAKKQILNFLHSEIIERRPYSSSRMCEEVIKFIEKIK